MSFPGTHPLASNTAWSQCHVIPCSAHKFVSCLAVWRIKKQIMLLLSPFSCRCRSGDEERHICQAGKHKSLPGTFWGWNCTEGRPEGQESEGVSSWIPVQNARGLKSFQHFKSFTAGGAGFPELLTCFFPTKFTLPCRAHFNV